MKISKTIILLFLTSVLVFSLCFLSCDKEKFENLPKKGEIMEYRSFNLDAWLKPLWDTREVYNETVMFVGEDDESKLLYFPSEILSVTDYTLQKNFVNGVDFSVTEDGKIKRLKNSAIPFFEIDDYYRLEPDSVQIGIFGNPRGLNFKEKRYAKYGEGDTFTSKQICITYTTDSPFNATKPQGKSYAFQGFISKLKNKETLNAVFYGDSITVGCNASGTPYGGNVSPFTPTYPDMIKLYLENKFEAKINVINTSVGGVNTEWGENNVQERVASKNPDLAVIAFGMNDSALSLIRYKNCICKMIDEIAISNPQCEFLIVSTTVPNPETDWYQNQQNYFKALLELERSGKYPNMAVADMTTFHQSLLSLGKRFGDMTGNNINHPNDFLIRGYAQVILKTVLGDDFV